MGSIRKKEPQSMNLLSKFRFAILISAIFTTSFGILAFEITLTRIFSVTYSYHYAFLAISLAFAGLGLGGIASKYLIFTKYSVDQVLGRLAAISLLFSILAPTLTIIVALSPKPNILSGAGLTFIPFLLGGIFLAAAYQVFGDRGNLLYFSDLIGAAFGSLAVLLFFSHFDAISTLILIGSISLIGSLLLAYASRRRAIVVVALSTLLLLALSVQYLQKNNIVEIRIAEGQGKELNEGLAHGGRIVESRWSLFGRTDLVEFETNPSMKAIYVDGAAPTRMHRFNGNPGEPNNEVLALRYSAAYYPYYFVNKESALIIGPGGGMDVLIALMAGVKNITAVEVNPEIVEIVREQSDFNGGIYTEFDNVQVITGEGRSFLRRSTGTYDIIMLNIPVTRTSQGLSGYSLAESYLFTDGSFRDYINHLEEDGYLAVVAHQRAEIYKLVTIAIKVLQAKGLDGEEIMRRIVVTEKGGMFPVLIVKESAFTSEEAKEMYAKSNQLGFTPIYFPYTDVTSLDPMLVGFGRINSPLDSAIQHFRDHHKLEVQPPSDDRPFFYKFNMGLPTSLSFLLFGTGTLSGFVLIAYLRRERPNPTRKGRLGLRETQSSPFIAFYFLSLGLGFMLIEVSLIQRFILFLGHPTSAISIMIFSILVSSGIGSLYSKRWTAESLGHGLRASLIVGLLAISYIVMLPPLFDVFLRYGSVVRFSISILVIIPIGIFLGMPFPNGIRFLSKGMKRNIPWMWGINGTFSLMGSILAIAIAITTGFSMALLLGGLSYLGIYCIGRAILSKERIGGGHRRNKKKKRKGVKQG